MKATVFAFLAILATPQLADAQQYVSTFRGTVDRIGSLQTFGSDGRIAAGNTVSITLSYDASNVSPIPQTSGNIYVIPVAYSFRFGDYVRSGQSGSVYLGVYDNKQYSTFTADSGSFNFIAETGNLSDQPFMIGSGPTYSALNIYFGDDDGSTINGADFTQLLRLGAFPSVHAELGFYNASTSTGVTAFSSNLVASTNVVAIPEPATWALMLFGFGAIGMAVRRRAKAPASACSA